MPWQREEKEAGALTWAGVVEIVVILRYICHDAEAIRDLHGDHIVGIQQSGDSQLPLRHLKGLQGFQRGRRRNRGQAKAPGRKETPGHKWNSHLGAQELGVSHKVTYSRKQEIGMVNNGA